MIKVKTLTGKEIEIDIELTDTVERIKERVEEKEGIPPVQQRLIFAGKQMNDEKTAKEYNIEGGSVLHLVRNANWPTKGVSPPLSLTPSSPFFADSPRLPLSPCLVRFPGPRPPRWLLILSLPGGKEVARVDWGLGVFSRRPSQRLRRTNCVI